MQAMTYKRLDTIGEMSEPISTNSCISEQFSSSQIELKPEGIVIQENES